MYTIFKIVHKYFGYIIKISERTEDAYLLLSCLIQHTGQLHMSSFISDSILSFLCLVIAKKIKLKVLFVKE